MPETAETHAPESLSALQQNTTSEGAGQPTATMAAFEQGPEVADVQPKEVAPAPVGGAGGFSFIQTSELAGPESHAVPAAQEQLTGQADNAFVHPGASEGGPGVGMTNAPGAEDGLENTAAPSFAQLEAQTVSVDRLVFARENLSPSFQLSGQQPGSFNWADAEDSHHVPETFSTPSATEAPLTTAAAPITTEELGAQAGIEPALALDATSQSNASGQAPQSGFRGGRGRGGQRGGFRGGARGAFRGGNRNAGSNTNGNGNGQSAKPSSGPDDDGFQVAGRRRPAPNGAPGQGGSFRGRGRGFPNGPGAGGEGRGRGSFRGRGGAAGGGERLFDNSSSVRF